MRHTFYLLCLLLGLAACTSTKELDSVDAGRTQVAEPGLPNFDMEVVPTWREDQSGFDLYIGLPYNSLIYYQRGSILKAAFETHLQVFLEGQNQPKLEEMATDSLKANYQQSQSARVANFKKRYKLPVGTYTIKLSITDLGTQKIAVRRQRITIQSLAQGGLSMSRVLVEGKLPQRSFEPVVALHTPENIDSLRAVTELYNTGNLKEVEVRMALVKYRADMLPAAPPFMFSPMYGNVAYRGIEFTEQDTLQKSLKRISNPLPETIVEFNLPKLAPGVYHILLKSKAEGQAEQISKRVLYVKEQGFPKVETLNQMIEPLVYISYPQELRALLNAKPEDRKAEFDKFWGEQMPSRQAAENTLRVFYSRVEEANLYFSTQKEGWKTDKGMIYILLGAPASIEQQGEAEVWRYSFNSRDPFAIFEFRRVYPLGDDGFVNYILARQSIYEGGWRRRAEGFRQGVAF